MKNFVSRYYVIFILLIIFAAPGFIALYVYQNPQLLAATTATNKGQLLKPTIKIDALKQSSKWHLIYSQPGNCDETCEQALEKLAKIRLALGRRLYQVELNLGSASVLPAKTGIHPHINRGDDNKKAVTMNAFANTGVHASTKLTTLLKEADIRAFQHAMPSALAKPAIFIANPEGHLILTYTPDTLPKDIFHDLKLLVSNAEQGKSS